MNTEVMFSSKTDLWSTPQDLFDELNEEFHFTLDPCADETNHKCEKYYTKEQDGLSQCWRGETVFCNPPYGKETGDWIKRCYIHSVVDCGTAVMLIPARTDTKWFHDYIYNKPNVEIRFIKGRLKFGGSKNSAPFPSMIAVFRHNEVQKSEDINYLKGYEDGKQDFINAYKEYIGNLNFMEELGKFADYIKGLIEKEKS